MVSRMLHWSWFYFEIATNDVTIHRSDCKPHKKYPTKSKTKAFPTQFPLSWQPKMPMATPMLIKRRKACQSRTEKVLYTNLWFNYLTFANIIKMLVAWTRCWVPLRGFQELHAHGWGRSEAYLMSSKVNETSAFGWKKHCLQKVLGSKTSS